MPSSEPDATEERLFRILGGLRESREDPLPAFSQSPLPSIPRYQIQSLLGEGATSTVYRAWDRTLGRPVALKVLRDRASISTTARERFRREAQAAAGLAHPNVVLVYDTGEAEGRPYLVMEAIEGRPLRDVIEDPTVSLADRVALLEKAARGLQAAHAKHIVHRDVKPANILVANGGEPKVADFGLAHIAGVEAGLTRTGAALGTPLYMAPEQVTGRSKEVSPRTDVYALGAILYEMLVGRPPHMSETVAELYEKIAREEPTTPRRLRPEVPPELETVALKALAKDVKDRYPEAGAFADDLKRWRIGEPIGSLPVPGWRRVARRMVRSRAAAGAAVATLVLVAAAVAFVRSAEARGRESRALALLESAKRPLEQAERLLRNPEAAYSSLLERLKVADPLIAEARALAPQLALATYREGEAWELKGFPDRAGSLYERAREQDPRFGSARFRLGRILLARAYLVNVDLKLEPPENIARRAEALAAQASAEFDSVRRQGSGVDDELQREISAAMLAHLRRDKLEVRRICRAALARFPNADGTEELHWLLGLVADSGTEQKAAFDEALRLRPKSPLILFSRARTLQLHKDRPGAVRDLSEAIAFSPEFAEAYVRRGSLRGFDGDTAGATADFDRLIALGQILPGAYNGRGWVRIVTGDLDGAIADFDEAIRLNPGYYFLPYYHRALAWSRKGRRDKALPDVDRALTLFGTSEKGEYAEGRVLRAKLRFEDGNLQGAREDVEAVLKQSPRHPEALQLLEKLPK